MKIAIIGTGYVGLVTGASLAALGNEVTVVGRDSTKTDKINKGKSPFYEPGLDELIQKTLNKKLLHATTDFDTSVQNAEIIIIGVGTPTRDNKIDLTAIEKASEQIGTAIKDSKKYKVVVVKSTVVPTTTEKVVGPIVEKFSGKKVGEFGLGMNPEFLREGQAVVDALKPDRIVIGAHDDKAAKTFLKIYKKVKTPKLITNLRTAEMIKYASNALFATLISYSNEVSRICEGVGGVDALEVWEGVHLDKRLSPTVGKKRVRPGVNSFILSGAGYGGSCFPKDTKALAYFADSVDVDAQIIKNVIEVNRTQPERMVRLLKNTVGKLKGKKIAVLGLSFKPDTDDLRESPSIPVLKLLAKEGADVIAHDPTVKEKNGAFEGINMQIAKSINDALSNAEAVLLMTAWKEYRELEPKVFKKKMSNAIIIDGRRIYSKKAFIEEGIIYKGIGLN
jgi:UDPglucose 6-dehydrogenase